MVRWHYYLILLLSYIIIYVLHCFWLALVVVCTTMLLFVKSFFSVMAINASVHYNGGLPSDIVLLTQCYYHRGTRLNAMEMICLCSL